MEKIKDAADIEVVRSDIIALRHPYAGSIAVSGGKGANMARLRALSSSEHDLHIPETQVVTTSVYENLILGNSAIRKLIVSLDKTSHKLKLAEFEPDKTILGVELKAKSKNIRTKIQDIELPVDLRKEIEKVFNALGGIIAVRSSANGEDLKEISAAGQAHSFLNVTSRGEALNCVKKVWASLFTDQFVNIRNRHQVSHLEAHMAVLLQPLIKDVKAAGTVFSVKPLGRPGYYISAQPGLGEGVVQGLGETDSWFIGLGADVILERQISKKTSKIVREEAGGVKKIKIADPAACLSNEEALRVAEITQIILGHYRQADLADHIDVEFAVDRKGLVHVLQARSYPRQNIRQEPGKAITLTLTSVDEHHLSPDCEIIDLDPTSLVVHPGAIVAELQLVTSPREAKAGRIIVTQHANNEWNGNFASIKGLITVDGGDTSHVARNAQALDIPALVLVSGVFEQLKPFHSRIVTFDAERRKVYVCEAPIRNDKRDLSMWISDRAELAAIEANKKNHELYREWEENISTNPGIFRADFEGNWRRRSNSLRPFQLAIYYKAWNQLTDYLNKKYNDRVAWVLVPRERKLEKRSEPGRWGLLEKIEPNDRYSTYHFLASLRDIDLRDFRGLIEARWQAFRDFDSYLARIKAIDHSNVEELIDRLIELFSWMHFAHWLNAGIDQLFVFDQLKYINSKFHYILRELSIRPEPADKKVDLSRLKDKETFIVLEQIRSRPEVLALFLDLDNQALAPLLNQRAPDIARTITSWSVRFKSTCEHLDVLDDTEEYFDLIRERLREGSSLGLRPVASWFREYDRVFQNWGNQSAKEIVHYLGGNQSELYWLLRGYARSELASKHNVIALSCSEDDVIRYLPKALQSIVDHLHQQEIVESQIRLNEFPRLKETLALSKLETTLREDGHHHVVKFQRKLARMMLTLASHYPHIFSEPNEIFSLTPGELVALLKDRNPAAYLKLTFNRWRILEEAEQILVDTGGKSANHQRAYEQKVLLVIDILDQQYTIANNQQARSDYEEEKRRLQSRIKKLRELWLPINDGQVRLRTI